MDEFHWRAFLEVLSKELLEEDDIRSTLPDEVVASGWLGFEGASESDIQVLESRLGAQLPPSYRQFLSVSNGWRTVGIYEPRLSPTSKVEWFRVHHLKRIEAWQQGERLGWKGDPPPVPDEKYDAYGREQDPTSMRSEYLHSALLISDGSDEADYLLNPRVIFPDGEWEAWKFAHWIPGAHRRRSFREMMEYFLWYARWQRD